MTVISSPFFKSAAFCVFILVALIAKSEGTSENYFNSFKPRISHLQSFGERLLFVADDGIHGTELWILDDPNAASARLVKDFIYGKNDGVIDVKVLNDKIAIVVTHTHHIWSTDGTDSGTQLLGISQYPVKVVVWNSKALLNINDGLFWTDGYDLHKLEDIILYPQSVIAGSADCNGKLYFTIQQESGVFSWDGNTLDMNVSSSKNLYHKFTSLACRNNNEIVAICLDASFTPNLCLVDLVNNITTVIYNGPVEPKHIVAAPNNVVYFYGKQVADSNNYVYALTQDNNVTRLLNYPLSSMEYRAEQNILAITKDYLLFPVDSGYIARHYLSTGNTSLTQIYADSCILYPAFPTYNNDIIAISDLNNSVFWINMDLQNQTSLLNITCPRSSFISNSFTYGSDGGIIFSAWTNDEGEVIVFMPSQTIFDPFPGPDIYNVRLFDRIPNSDRIILAADSSNYGIELFAFSTTTGDLTPLEISSGCYGMAKSLDMKHSLTQNGMVITAVGLDLETTLLYTNGTVEETFSYNITFGNISFGDTINCSTPDHFVFLLKDSMHNTLYYTDKTDLRMFEWSQTLYLYGCSETSNHVYLADSQLNTFDFQQMVPINVTENDFTPFTSTIVNDTLLIFTPQNTQNPNVVLMSINSTGMKIIDCPNITVNMGETIYRQNETHVILYAVKDDGKHALVVASLNYCGILTEWIPWTAVDIYTKLLYVAEDGTVYFTVDESSTTSSIYRWNENGLALFAIPGKKIGSLLHVHNGVVIFEPAVSGLSREVWAVRENHTYSIPLYVTEQNDPQHEWVKMLVWPETQTYLWEIQDSNVNGRYVKRTTPPCETYDWCGERSDSHCDLACSNNFCVPSTVVCDGVNNYCNVTVGQCFEYPPPSIIECPEPKPQPERFFTCDTSQGVWIGQNITLEDEEEVVLTSQTIVEGDLRVPENSALVFKFDTFEFGPRSLKRDRSTRDVHQSTSTDYLLTVNGNVVVEGDIVMVVGTEQISDMGSSAIGEVQMEIGLVDAVTISKGESGEKPTVELEVNKQEGEKVCEETSLQTDHHNEGSRQQLSVLLSVNNVNCHLWWIVLVPVLGVLILVTVFIILVLKRRRLRTGLLPYRDTEL